MGRSLEIKVKQSEVENDKIEIDANGSIISLNVIVDGSDDNASFTVTSFNSYWFTYSIERNNINVSIPKNLTTQKRRGSITIEHNCADLSKTINIIQKEAEYTIKLDSHYESFKSVPKDENYEERIVNIVANGGRQKWYVKDIRQYQASELDNFKDDEYNGLMSQENTMSQVRVPYDGVFNYKIEGNSLIVRSYGQIDLTRKMRRVNQNSNPHMRYFFTISHKDVDNENSLYIDKNKEEKYEDNILFSFDGNDISGYGSSDDGTEKPNDNDKYIFLVNNSEEPSINCSSSNKTETVTVTSTKNGMNVDYSTKSNTEWCSIDKNIITINENTSYDNRTCEIIFTQNESNNVIVLKVSQHGADKATNSYRITNKRY